MGQTNRCGRAEALSRLEQAYAHALYAEMDPFSEDGATRSVTVSNAVLAGIAASDTICCLTLGERSSSDNHEDAVRLIGSVSGIGRDAASYLVVLLGAKNKAQHLSIHPNIAETKRSMRAMRALIEMASSYR